MSNTIKILVVDDEPVIRQLLEAILVPEGYILLFGINGEEAIEIAENEVPDIILLDVMMPNIDGFEVCRRIRENKVTAHIPVLLITALDDRDSRIRGIGAGADDYISKPFDRIEILAKLKNIVAQIKIRSKRHLSEVNPVSSVFSYSETLVDWLVSMLNPKVKDNEEIISYQSTESIISHHSFFVEEVIDGKYIGLISNKLPLKNSSIANSIFKQLLINNLKKNPIEPDQLLTKCHSELSGIKASSGAKVLNITDFSVVLVYLNKNANEITVSGLNQNLFINLHPKDKTQAQENYFQAFTLKEQGKLKFNSPGTIYLFSTDIHEHMSQSDIINQLISQFIKPPKANFQDKIKEYYKKSDDFIVVQLTY